MSGPAAPDAGLCTTCVHARWVESTRSRFLRCGLSDSDPAFPRYPRLPVLECRGFRRGNGESQPRVLRT